MRFLRYRNRNLQLHFILVFSKTWYHTVADSIQYHIFEILAFNIFCDTGSSEMLYPSDNEFVEGRFQPFFDEIHTPIFVESYTSTDMTKTIDFIDM